MGKNQALGFSIFEEENGRSTLNSNLCHDIGRIVWQDAFNQIHLGFSIMSKAAKEAYAKKINRVCDYIRENLTDDLTGEKLSQIANFSKYHFHRQFSEYTGITTYKFVQLARLKRASYQLTFIPDYPIIDIALEARFENPESFSRAFKNTFGQTPSQFRKTPDWKSWAEKYEFNTIKRDEKMDVKTTSFAETKVAVLEHRGDSNLINDSVLQFIDWRKNSKLSPVATSHTYGLAYDDPNTTIPEKFRFDICGVVKTEVPENSAGVINKIIPAGRCAIVRHYGAHEEMIEKVHYLYCDWLPNSGEELRDFPCYFHYIKLFPQVNDNDLITDIYLPLL